LRKDVSVECPHLCTGVARGGQRTSSSANLLHRFLRGKSIILLRIGRMGAGWSYGGPVAWNLRIISRGGLYPRGNTEDE
jgi:hypothetical protein